MPVATQASLKGLTPSQLADTGCRICLNNTYHLALKPTQATLDAISGSHRLQSWPHNILTDSGGFQMVSLLKLATVTEEGVRFLSPHDGAPMLLTPEQSIALQRSIGSDIVMQLDDVIVTTSSDEERMGEAVGRSVRWLDRCVRAMEGARGQALFCIIQGGLSLPLRTLCTKQMLSRDTPGIAIGGLSGGESKSAYCAVVAHVASLLPRDKPRYVMGVGYPEDLVVSVALGADMFDCVYATRTARFGNALCGGVAAGEGGRVANETKMEGFVNGGTLNLRRGKYANDFSVIDEGCGCRVCWPRGKVWMPPVWDPDSHPDPASAPNAGLDSHPEEKSSRNAEEEGQNPGPKPKCNKKERKKYGLGISRSYIHHLTGKETVGAHLLSIHNTFFLLQLMREMRAAIIAQRFPDWIRAFFGRRYWRGEEPGWVVDALRGVGVDLHSRE